MNYYELSNTVPLIPLDTKMAYGRKDMCRFTEY